MPEFAIPTSSILYPRGKAHGTEREQFLYALDALEQLLGELSTTLPRLQRCMESLDADRDATTLSPGECYLFLHASMNLDSAEHWANRLGNRDLADDLGEVSGEFMDALNPNPPHTTPAREHLLRVQNLVIDAQEFCISVSQGN